jgi:hypothetical protein
MDSPLILRVTVPLPVPCFCLIKMMVFDAARNQLTFAKASGLQSGYVMLNGRISLLMTLAL